MEPRPHLVNPRNRRIGSSNHRIALKFQRHIGSNAAEVPVKFRSDAIIITPNLGASSLHDILR